MSEENNENQEQPTDNLTPPQFPVDRTELNEDRPSIPEFPKDRIEKGEKPGDFEKKDK